MGKPDIEGAAQAFKDFTGRDAKWVERQKLDDTDRAGYRMGKVVGVAYEATRDGETAQYFHRFAKRSRPELVASSDGRQLYIQRGSYKVTDRGIEDRMPALFVVNPSPRKGKKSAMAMRRRRKSRRHHSGKTNLVVVRNPVRRRRRRASGRRSLVAFKRNPVHRRRRRASGRMSIKRFRRNPMSLAVGNLNMGALLVPGILVGAGAVGSEVLMASIPGIPASWKVGITRHFVKAGIGIAAGMAVASLLRMRKVGEYIALGSITIATHDAIKDALAANVPSVPLGEYVNTPHPQFGYASVGQIADMGATGGMGEYVTTPHPQFAGV